MSFAAEEGYNLFDALAPSSDQEFDYGAVVTYSLDLVALTGLVGVLSGSRAGLRRLSPVELVKALDQLKGKLAVVCQRGRIAVPRGAPSIIAQLERFIREEPYDERVGSWHPKAVLCAYRSRHSMHGEREWRLWLGSRNLTGSSDLEAGLFLIGRWSEEPLQQPEGLPLLLQLLLKHSFGSHARRSRIISDLTTHVRWRAPDGVELEALHSWTGRSGADRPTVDLRGIDASEAVVISPFMDEGGLKVLRTALSGIDKPNQRRILVTTAERLSLQSLRDEALEAGFELRVFTPPAIDVGAEGLAQPDIAAEDGEGPDGEPADQERGLHAKIYMFRAGPRQRATMFLAMT